MYLSISPDFDARWCYGIVLLCGLISARIQVYKRLSESNIAGIWLDPATWLMFVIYLAVPLALFWFMDRMGALRDTSLFAALLIGAAYPAVLSGNVAGIKAPEGLDFLRKPIENFTDTVVKRLVKRAARNDTRFKDFIVGRMGDDDVYKKVLDLTRDKTPDSDRLDIELQSLDAPPVAGNPQAPPAQPGAPQPPAPQADAGLVRRRKSRVIYLYLSSIPDFEMLVRESKIFPLEALMQYAPRYRNLVVALVGSIMASIVGIAVLSYVLTQPHVQVSYFVWRLQKPDNSPYDRLRARQAITSYFAPGAESTYGASQALIYKELTTALRSPSLPIDRVDLILQLLMECRHSSTEDDQNLASCLTDALRAEAIDARYRYQQVLLMLAREHVTMVDDNLSKWDPSKGDSIPSLEEHIKRWQEFWKNPASGNSQKVHATTEIAQ